MQNNMDKDTRTEVRRIGSFILPDNNGFLVNPTNVNLLQPAWKQAILDLVEILQSVYENSLHSIYIRGSAARGLATDNVSDLDSIIVVRDKVDRKLIESEIKKLKDKYPFITKIEAQFVLLEDILDSEKNKSKKFTIGTQSLNVFGEDLRPELPKFKPDESLSKIFFDDLDSAFENVRSKLNDNISDEEIKKLCTWLMKRLLRSSFLLIMPRVQKFTRDLYLCYEEFVKFYPEYEVQMREILELAVNPTTDKAKIIEIIDGYGKWLNFHL